MTLATIFAPDGPVLGPDERAFFRAADPWGFILFARNVVDPAQVSRLTADLREAVGRDAPILIDQEGGRVQRLGPPHWRKWMAPLSEAEFGHPRSFYLRYALIAAELRAVGIDVNCAPSCDIAGVNTHHFLRNRCLGSSADEVIPNVRAAIGGHLAGGCLPVVKHAPGHGRAVVDSHLGLPVADAPLNELLESDFRVFHSVRDAPMVMSAHIVVPALDPDHPATMSRIVMDFLRMKIGMEGLVISDDVSMGALSGDLPDRTRHALAAGCDIVLHCNGKAREMADIAAAAPELTGEAALRANRALDRRPKPSLLDPDVLLAEYRALTSGEA
jgi:beta-N-acetylhexosaminidase